MSLEVEDRVADELAGAVEGDVATTLHLVELDAALTEELRRRGEMLVLRRAAERDHRRMLQQEQHVLLEASRDARGRDRPLQLERFAVGDATEADGPELRHGASGPSSRAPLRRSLPTASGGRGSRGPLPRR